MNGFNRLLILFAIVLFVGIVVQILVSNEGQVAATWNLFGNKQTSFDSFERDVADARTPEKARQIVSDYIATVQKTEAAVPRYGAVETLYEERQRFPAIVQNLFPQRIEVKDYFM